MPKAAQRKIWYSIDLGLCRKQGRREKGVG